MAGPYYVRSSDGNDADDGLSWANAKATFGAATALAAAGERIYVDDDHQETIAANTTYTFAGTEGNPIEVIVVTTDTTTAVSNYNAANQWIEGDTNNVNIFLTGEVYFWGIYLEWVGNSSQAGLFAGGKTITFEKSHLKLDDTGNTRHLGMAADDNTILVLIETDFSFSGTAGYLYIGKPANFIWRGGTLSGDVDELLRIGSEGPSIEIIGVDLSSMIGGTIINIDEGDEYLHAYLKGVKLNATQPVLITAGISPERGSRILMDIADNGNTIYKFRREYQYGYAQDETSKVITGKALYDGTNEFAVKMVSRATPTCSFYDPWRYHLTTLRETGFVANRTYTVHIAQDHASVQPDALDNDEIWIEVVYPDDSTAQFNIKTDKIATPTTTPAAQTTSTESWEGLAATTRLQELAATIASTDGKNGPVEIWICLAKESKTVYVCPEVYVS